MNDLRLTLLILGICIIAGLYLWERFRARGRRGQRSMLGELDEEGDKMPPISTRSRDNARDREDQSAALSDLRRFMAGSRSRPSAADPGERISPRDWRREEGGAPAAGSGASPESAAARDIISLHIMAGSAGAFRGPDVVRAAEIAGLKYGPLRVFHCFTDTPHPDPRPLFTLANLVEPGYFDMDGIETFSTRGLTVFMCLPVPVAGTTAFELMLSTAELIARELDGVVHGPGHAPIDDREIAALRERADRDD